MAGKGIKRRSKFILPLKLQLQYDLIKDLKLHLVIQGIKNISWFLKSSQPGFTCSKSRMETTEQCVKLVQSFQ